MNGININLIDCISEITNVPICMDEENYLYLDDFSVVCDSVLSEANKLKEAKESELRKSISITPRQARLILLQYDLLDDIEAMLSTDRAMQIWWEYSLDIKRNNEHIINAGIALNLTENQLDEMFIEGSKL